MKKNSIHKSAIAAAVLCLSGAALTPAAAQVNAFPQGIGSKTIEGYTLPRTVVTVTVVAEREVILRGPYAKFASQYLGISGAAMSDKENYRIIDASLGYYEEPDPAQTYQLDQPVDAQSKVFHWLSVAPQPKPLQADAEYEGANIGNNNPFTDISLNPLYGATTEQNGLASDDSFGALPFNQTSSIEKSTEQMAADAANAIFTLRKRRFDLVTGEMGENVFGAGLEAALKEMDRIEAEYLSLFIGKRYTQRIVKTYSVLPAAEGATIVCRFSPCRRERRQCISCPREKRSCQRTLPCSLGAHRQTDRRQRRTGSRTNPRIPDGQCYQRSGNILTHIAPHTAGTYHSGSFFL